MNRDVREKANHALSLLSSPSVLYKHLTEVGALKNLVVILHLSPRYTKHSCFCYEFAHVHCTVFNVHCTLYGVYCIGTWYTIEEHL